MPEPVELSAASVEAVARRVVEMISAKEGQPDEWLTRAQVPVRLNISASSFERLRRQHPEALKPTTETPLRWSRNAIDVFKMTLGAPQHHKPGRRPKARLAA